MSDDVFGSGAFAQGVGRALADEGVEVGSGAALTPEEAATIAEELAFPTDDLGPTDRRRPARIAAALMGAYELGRKAEREGGRIAAAPRGGDEVPGLDLGTFEGKPVKATYL
jgi:hypothetical protein